MKRCHFIISVIVFVVIFQFAKAEEPIQYYKAGDVGVFCVDIEIPPNVNINTTIITPQVNDKKAYLLYVKLAGSITQQVTDVMESKRSQRAEQEEFYKKVRELRRKENEISIQLQQTRTELEALKKIKQKAEKDQDNIFVEKTQLSIREAETKISELTEQNNELAQQRQKLYEQRSDFRREPQVKTVPDQVNKTLKVFGRFQGSGNVKLSIYMRDSAKLLAEPSLMKLVDLNLPSVDTGNPELLKQWATAQVQQYIRRVFDSPYTSYYQYCILQSKDKYDLPSNIFYGFDSQERIQRRLDLYSMTTGALAIQETLQLEEMTGVRKAFSESVVPVNTLKGPNIKSHPFEEMLKGRTPKMFPVSALVPYDNYYCHFTSISKEIAATELIKQWGASLLRMMTVTARDSDLPSRYSEQLCIDVSILTKLFGDFIIGELAITGGDPFLREGSDIAVILEVKNKMIFDKIMDKYSDDTIKVNSDVQVSNSDYNGIAIRSIVTPDRRISSHSAYLGNYKVYSNSIDTLKLIIDTNAKKRESMADNTDFQYMRTIFPGTVESEDGFIYLSDPFIRKLLSAKWKVEGQRRIICQSHLRMIANAAAMYRAEMRKQPTIKTLIEQNYLNDAAIECPDGGEYSLDEFGRAFCTVHNCLQYCTAVSSVNLEKVTKEEESDYNRFVNRYNNYWSRYFDPIGIRFKLGNRIEVETCILPLIENSIYNQLRQIAGGEPVQMNSQVITDGTIASISCKLNPDSSLFKNIGMMSQESIPLMSTLKNCVGNNISLNFYDSDVLFTFSERGMSMFGGWMNLEDQIIFGLIASSINLPIYVVIDLKDEQLTKTFIQGLLEMFKQQFSAIGMNRFSEFGVESYFAGEYKNHEINTIIWRLFVIKFRLYYTITSNRLIVSTKRYVLEKVLDSLDGNIEKYEVANINFDVKPRSFDKLRPIVRVGWQERMREACLKNLPSIHVFMDCYNATEQTLDTVSKKVEGVTLRCPSGGTYKYDLSRDIIYCSIHGDRYHPTQPVQISDNEGLLDFIGRMTDFSVNFKFTEEGIMTKVAFDLESKKSNK